VSNNGTSAEVQSQYGEFATPSVQADSDLSIHDFCPVRNMIVVEPLPPDQMTKHGIHIPNAALVEKTLGIAIRVPENLNAQFGEGDMVLFHENAGQTIETGGTKYRILLYGENEEGDILGYWPKKCLDKPTAIE